MATKAGRAQFKDLVSGRVLWRVSAVQLPPGNIYVGRLERVTVVQKPFRTFLQSDDGVCRPDWSFIVQYDQGYWDAGTMRVHDCSCWGIQTDVSSTKPIGLKFFFMTEAAARRYMDRLQNYRLKDAFEHPRQFTKVKLPRVRYIRPYQFVVGGVICDHTTRKDDIEYFMEQSSKELGMMYPHVIKPLNISKDVTDAEIRKWSADPEAFKQPDPKELYPGVLDSLHREAADMMYQITSTPWTNRIPPGVVVIPGEVLGDPIKRAILEQDFVILDEVHPIGEDNDVDMFTAAFPKVFKKEE